MLSINNAGLNSVRARIHNNELDHVCRFRTQNWAASRCLAFLVLMALCIRPCFGDVLSRTGWTASASISDSGGPPANALDGNTGTRWSTGANQANGQWFQVDMGATQTFCKIVLDQSTSSGDYPRGYQVNVSNNGSTWGSPVATGNGTAGTTTIIFAMQTARYIRITQTGSASGIWWSICEFNVYTTSAPPAPLNVTESENGTQAVLNWSGSRRWPPAIM